MDDSSGLETAAAAGGTAVAGPIGGMVAAGVTKMLTAMAEKKKLQREQQIRALSEQGTREIGAQADRTQQEQSSLKDLMASWGGISR